MPNTALKSENVSENMQQDDEEGSKGGLLGLPESDTELDVSSDFFNAAFIYIVLLHFSKTPEFWSSKAS